MAEGLISEAPTAVAKLPLHCAYLAVVVIMRKDGEVEAKAPRAGTAQQRDKADRIRWQILRRNSKG
jgi:hypothetical protein